MKHPYSFLLSVATLLPNIAHGQYFTSDNTKTELASAQAHPLVILLPEENPKTLRQLADKPTELAQYKAYLTQYSAQARELAPKLWKLSPTVEFRPESAYKELSSNKKEQAVVLHYTEYSLNGNRYNPATNILGTYRARQMECELVGGRDGHTLWWGSSPLGGPTYAGDLVTTLRCLQTDLVRRAAQAGMRIRQSMAAEMLHQMQLVELLRTKTLLLNEADLRAQLTAAKVQALYPQAVQIVPIATIEAAILSGDTRYTYMRHLASHSGNIGFSVSDIASGEPLAEFTGPLDEGITEKDLKSLARIADSYATNAPKRAKLQQILNAK